MKKILKIFSGFIMMIAFSLYSCDDHKRNEKEQKEPLNISASDTALRLVNGILYYCNNHSFSGSITEAWPTGKIKSIRRITNGKEQGLSESFYEDGTRESTRWYKNAEKDSIHTGWWQNGNRKYEYHFKDGNYHGMFSEWYEDGVMLQQVMYSDGNEMYGKGWRETGKLYMNFVIRNGRRYGLNNSNLCYSLNRENVKL